MATQSVALGRAGNTFTRRLVIAVVAVALVAAVLIGYSVTTTERVLTEAPGVGLPMALDQAWFNTFRESERNSWLPTSPATSDEWLGAPVIPSAVYEWLIKHRADERSSE